MIVVNSYDPEEGIAHDLEIEPLGGGCLLRSRVNAKSASGSGSCRLSSLPAGRYRIRVRPLPPKGEAIGPKPIGKGFTKRVDLQPATSNRIVFSISRKQSILYNIPMTFRVSSNTGADNTEPIYEFDCMSKVTKHRLLIEAESKRQGVDPNLVKAIVYMETTHGWYDVLPAIIDANSSIQPMNVRSDYWKDLGYTREQLKNPENNIRAGVLLIKRIADRVHPRSIETIATLYNNLGATKVSDYGARIAQIYREKLWIPSPDMLDKVKQQIRKFERLSPVEQLNVLNRMFGGSGIRSPRW